MGRRIVVTSNCQLGGLHAALSAMLPDDEVIASAHPVAGSPALDDELRKADVWVTSWAPTDATGQVEALGVDAEVITVPLLLFPGFHPDVVHMTGPDGAELESAGGHYSSAIVAWGWRAGQSASEIAANFAPEVLEALGYHDAWDGAVHLARHVFVEARADFDNWFLPLLNRGPFMLTENHPRIDAVVQLARQVAARLGSDPERVEFGWEQVIPDGLLATAPVWPVYPTLADRLGFAGSTVWRCANGELIDLDVFVERSLRLYDHFCPDPSTTSVARFDHDSRYAEVLGGARVTARREKSVAASVADRDPGPVGAPKRPRHPYAGLPGHHRWRTAVTWAQPGGFDAVVEPRFTITPDDSVATMGSCFAQHLARHLHASGLDYLVTEPGPEELDDDEARARQYGVYTARYGNVYTVAQARQLIGRAFGDVELDEQPWALGDRWVDPFRPSVEPDGFADVQALERDRDVHLAAVRQMVTQADVMVFTLGLTEAWVSDDTGAVLPSVPGVAGGTFDPDSHRFVNFDVDQVRADLVALCRELRRHNADLRVLLTVSPVPLVATYESRHVVVSTVASKSVLRTAADHAIRNLDYVDYFPSYEMVASGAARRDPFQPDRREVDPGAVRQVMRSFSRHYIEGEPWVSPADASARTAIGSLAVADYPVICDEEAIEAAMAASRGQ